MCSFKLLSLSETPQSMILLGEILAILRTLEKFKYGIMLDLAKTLSITSTGIYGSNNINLVTKDPKSRVVLSEEVKQPNLPLTKMKNELIWDCISALFQYHIETNRQLSLLDFKIFGTEFSLEKLLEVTDIETDFRIIAAMKPLFELELIPKETKKDLMKLICNKYDQEYWRKIIILFNESTDQSAEGLLKYLNQEDQDDKLVKTISLISNKVEKRAVALCELSEEPEIDQKNITPMSDQTWVKIRLSVLQQLVKALEKTSKDFDLIYKLAYSLVRMEAISPSPPEQKISAEILDKMGTVNPKYCDNAIGQLVTQYREI